MRYISDDMENLGRMRRRVSSVQDFVYWKKGADYAT